MVSEARTLAEAVRQWQHDALPHIAALSRQVGIPIDLVKAGCLERADLPGCYTGHGRDVIQFIPPIVDKIVRTIGDARPTGEMQDQQHVVFTVGPNPVVSDMDLHWNIGEELKVEDATSKSYGWGVTVTSGFEIGGEASGGKISHSPTGQHQ